MTLQEQAEAGSIRKGRKQEAWQRPTEGWSGSATDRVHTSLQTDPGGYGSSKGPKPAKESKQAEEPTREKEPRQILWVPQRP